MPDCLVRDLFRVALVRRLQAVALALIAVACFTLSASAEANQQVVVVGNIDGIVDRATATYVDRVMTEAERAHASAVILSVDSPGGLGDAVSDINARIQRSNVPVIVKVPPDGTTSLADVQIASVARYSAADLSDVLRQADGATVQVASGPVMLHTAGATIRQVDMSGSESFLHTISNPTVAYLLLSLGCLGLLLEFFNPGSIGPGVIGGICLLLAFSALGTLPLNMVGVVLIGFGVLLLALEPFLVTHGVLGLGGAAAFAFGSFLLVNTPDAPFLQISPVAIVAVTAIFVGFMVVLVGFIMRTRRGRALTGHEGLLGATGVVRRTIEPGRQGMVQVLGELWRATAVEGGRLSQGDQIVVERVDGLVLAVRRVSYGVVSALRPASPAAEKSRGKGFGRGRW